MLDELQTDLPRRQPGRDDTGHSTDHCPQQSAIHNPRVIQSARDQNSSSELISAASARIPVICAMASA